MTTMQAQTFQTLDENGNVNQTYGSNGNFNPNKRDSLASNKEIPRGVWAWTVDRLFGDITPCELDTMPHLYQNSIYNTGIYGEYNSTGSNYTPRLSRIFIDRKRQSEFFFVDSYDYMRKEPDQFHFLNTLSPYTNISYDNCGDKQNGEDHIDAKFAVNANKRLGFGFDLDYYYARGYYKNQSNSHFRASLFGSYRGDRYQMHILATSYQHKANENGGITNDNYITHPELFTEQYTESEIPTVLEKNWNRNTSQHLFLSHRYNIGFYRKVKMTDEEIRARKFAEASAKANAKTSGLNMDEEETSIGRPIDIPISDVPAGRPADAKIMGNEPVAATDTQQPDTTRIKIDSAESLDSVLTIQHEKDSLEQYMKREYVPVTSIIHTLDINNYEGGADATNLTALVHTSLDGLTKLIEKAAEAYTKVAGGGAQADVALSTASKVINYFSSKGGDVSKATVTADTASNAIKVTDGTTCVSCDTAGNCSDCTTAK
jgi:hypothetical protein